MKCPSCAAPSGEDAAECPSCGLVFAKWRERREKEKREAVAALKALEAPAASSASSRNLWIARGMAAAAVALWLAGLALYYHRRLARVPLRRVSRSFGGREWGPC